MKIEQRFIRDESLGQLHVVRFEPENARPDELGICFNALNGRSTTIDAFGTAYLFASLRNQTVDFIERPATGLSTLPEDSALRRDYRKHGFTAIQSALVEAQSSPVSDPKANDFESAKRIDVGGSSLGGYTATLYGQEIGDRLASVTTVDAPGNSSVFVPVGVLRFDGYYLVEAIANRLKLKESIDGKWAERPDIVDALKEYKRNNPDIPEPPRIKAIDRTAEQVEVLRPTKGAAAKALRQILWSAAEDERVFEYRAQMSLMRFLTDHQSITQTNAIVNEFEQEFPENQTVRYGFLQGLDLGWWHDSASTPGVIERLINTPVSKLRKRLGYFS